MVKRLQIRSDAKFLDICILRSCYITNVPLAEAIAQIESQLERSIGETEEKVISFAAALCAIAPIKHQIHSDNSPNCSR